MDMQENNLIFLVSSPRSGSTLLQHLLGSHSEIHTVPEPWFMLHLVYGLHGDEMEAPYNSQYAHIALQEYLESIPDGAATYRKGIGKMATLLYEQSLRSTNKKFFLDKTPRYYMILQELFKIFPNAKYILLVRNPIAVLSSILETNFKGDFRRLFSTDRRNDLFTAPRNILEASKLLGDNAKVVHYERLVADPPGILSSLCDFLDIPYEPGMVNYGNKLKFETKRFVDPKSIYLHDQATNKFVDEWADRLRSNQDVHLSESYLSSLGPELISELGYDYDELKSKILGKKTRGLLPVSSWKLLTKRHEDLTVWDRSWLNITSGLQLFADGVRRYGMFEAVRKSISHLRRGISKSDK